MRISIRVYLLAYWVRERTQTELHNSFNQARKQEEMTRFRHANYRFTPGPALHEICSTKQAVRMKNFHLSKSPDLRQAYARKLTFRHHGRVRKYSAERLVSLLMISKQHAYRLIAHPERLTDQQRELLIYKDIRLLPGWGPDWIVEETGLRAPNGNLITAETMAYNAQVHQRHAELQEQVADLHREIDALRNHIHWLHGKLARPPEARHPEYDRGPIVIAKKFEHARADRRGWNPEVIDGKASGDK